jgi:hypothetical protein
LVEKLRRSISVIHLQNVRGTAHWLGVIVI